MVSTGFALALLTTAGALAIYSKLPKRIRRLVIKYQLLTDVLTLIGVYLLLGGTITALFAAAICGLAVSALLYVANHREDFLYLFDAKEVFLRKVRETQQALNEYGKRYRESRETSS